MKIGILNCSNIAKTRMIPAMLEIPGVTIEIISSSSITKANEYAEMFNIPISTSDKNQLLDKTKIDAVYISSPPSEHYEWVKKFLENGIHVLCEKSLTDHVNLTSELIEIANKNNVILQENYAFQFHDQWKFIKSKLNEIGNIQYINASFEFPPRDKSTDFRYKKELGGGALLDAGGYPIKIASLLFPELNGKSDTITIFRSNKIMEGDIDISGNLSVISNDWTMFLNWSMNSPYKCNLEISGSEGRLIAPKIFTARSFDTVSVIIENLEGDEKETFFRCNQFKELVIDFIRRIDQSDNSHHIEIIKQSIIQAYAKSSSIGTVSN